MVNTRIRTSAAIATGVLLIAALAGCGGGSEKDPVAAGKAVDKTSFVNGLLASVKEQKSARAELSLGTAISAEAAFEYGGKKPEAQISAKLFGGTINVVIADGAVYIQREAGAKYTRLTEDDPSLAMLGGGFSDLDPKATLGKIGAGIKEVREIGPATVDGQELTHFAATIDGNEIGDGMLGMLPGVDLSKDIVLDLYLDADDLVRQVTAELGENDLDLTITDWGKPVTITVPPASEVLNSP